MPRRSGNNPKRRIMSETDIDPAALDRILNEARYVGSAHHKRTPGDYGFTPPANPRPNKSHCDGRRRINADEARNLFQEGVKRGMVSPFAMGELPKYVWAVDDEERAYEAKAERTGLRYHGYELGNDDEAMRRLVIAEWKARCPAN